MLDNVTFGVWHLNNFDNLELDDRLSDLTGFHIAHFLGVQPSRQFHAHSVENILERCDTEWCLVQTPGHNFTSSVQASVFKNYTERRDVAAFGHIIDDKGYYGLHHQMFMVNVGAWRDNGRPAFGRGGQKEQAVCAVRRSEADIHDDYTPLYLHPAGLSTKRARAATPGWNLISESVKKGQKIENLCPALRRAKFFAYPQRHNADEYLHVLSDTVAHEHAARDEHVLSTLRRLKTGTFGIHAINNEPMHDIPKRAETPIDLGVFVSSGFKSNVVLERQGFTPETKVVFYDVYAPSLLFKRLLIERWDGVGFLSFVDRVMPEITNASTTTIHNDVNLEQTFAAMVEKEFGGSEGWLNHWRRFRQLQFSFVECNILYEPQKLANVISAVGRQSKRCVLWTSNIFDFCQVVRDLSYTERKRRHAKLIAAVSAASGVEPIAIGIGPSHFGRGPYV